MAFEEPLWCQGFCLKPLSAATRQLFNHPGALSQALDQMETIKLFAAASGFVCVSWEKRWDLFSQGFWLHWAGRERGVWRSLLLRHNNTCGVLQ